MRNFQPFLESAGGTHRQWVLRCFLFHKMKQRAGGEGGWHTRSSSSRSFSALPSPRSHVQDPQWDAHVRSSWNKVSSDPATQLLQSRLRVQLTEHILKECWCCLKWIRIWNTRNYRVKTADAPELALNQWNHATCQRVTLANILILLKVS